MTIRRIPALATMAVLAAFPAAAEEMKIATNQPFDPMAACKGEYAKDTGKGNACVIAKTEQEIKRVTIEGQKADRRAAEADRRAAHADRKAEQARQNTACSDYLSSSIEQKKFTSEQVFAAFGDADEDAMQRMVCDVARKFGYADRRAALESPAVK